jgi:hypothetical protein
MSLPQGDLFLICDAVEAGDGEYVQPPLLQAPDGVLPVEVDPGGGQPAQLLVGSAAGAVAPAQPIQARLCMVESVVNLFYIRMSSPIPRPIWQFRTGRVRL